MNSGLEFSDPLSNSGGCVIFENYILHKDLDRKKQEIDVDYVCERGKIILV